MKRFAKRLLKGVLLLIFGVSVLCAALLAGLQTEPGRTALAAIINHFGASATAGFRVSGVRISWGLDAAIAKLTLTDARGEWLEISDATLNWTPSALLGGVVSIRAIDVAAIEVYRKPVAPPSEPTGAESSGAGGIRVPPLQLDALEVKRIALAEPVAGATLQLEASGSAKTAKNLKEILAKLDIDRTDEADGSLSADIRFQPDLETLNFALVLHEGRGGLAARLLNIEDLPALDVDLKGDGPLDNWRADLSLSLDGERTVSGTATLSQNSSGRRLVADLAGNFEALSPPELYAFLLGRTDIALDARFSSEFEPLSARLNARTATVDLQASGERVPDTGRMQANGKLTISAGGEALIGVELGQRRIMLGSTSLSFTAKGSEEALDWSADVNLASFETSEAKLGATSLSASGEGAELSQGTVVTPFSMSLDAKSVTPLLPGFQDFAGDLAVSVQGKADSAGPAVELTRAEIKHPVAEIELKDVAASMRSVSGNGTFRLPDLARFSGLAKQDLKGALSGEFTASANPADLAGSAEISASGQGFGSGITLADELLGQDPELSFQGDFTADGSADLSRLELVGQAIRVLASGSGNLETVDAKASVALSDLSLLNPRASGGLDLDATIQGPVSKPQIAANLTSQNLILIGKAVDALRLNADIVADRTAPTAQVSLAGTLDGKEISGEIQLGSEESKTVLKEIHLVLGQNRIEGSLTAGPVDDFLKGLSGSLKIDAPDISELSPLVLTEIAGRVEGTIDAGDEDGILAVRADVSGGDISLPGATVGSFSTQAVVFDPLGALRAEGTATASDIAAGGAPIKTISLQARNSGNRTDIELDARLAEGDGADGIAATAILIAQDAGLDITLDKMDGRYAGLTTSLARQGHIILNGGTATVEALSLKLGNGSLDVSGTAGETLDLAAKVDNVPLSLANAFSSGLGLGGTASGSATVKGKASAPDAKWTVDIAGLSAAAMDSNGIPALTVNSTGTMKGRTIDQRTVVTGVSGLEVTASGQASLASPVTVDMKIGGNVPLELARRKLTLAGLSGKGGVRVEATVEGPVTGLRYSGTVTPQELQVTELGSGMTLRNFAGTIALSNDGARIEGLSAELGTGGQLTANGSVGLAGGFPADINMTLRNGRYMDGSTISAKLNADLALKGPLADPARGASLSGRVDIERADINIPDQLPAAINPVAVQHKNASAAVRAQSEALSQGQGDGGGGSSRPISLDVTVSAPNQIFVRGRGLDAELGGTLKLTGTTSNPQAVGGFSLIRGRMGLLTRQITFEKGIITFTGSLMPRLDFAATTSTSDANITITVRGEAEAPTVALTSSPELPQDEILARLLFDQSVSDLSPAQIAQLAASVAVLTGGSGEGPLGQLRKSLGLDAIDIVNDGDKGPALSVGKYINDNIYLGVKQGTGDASSRVTVDIDVSKNIKLRGEVGADGETKAGVFFEKEY
ncbi:translocation/assembly module TamB domain-containing protein [Rhizobiales bacterium]|uniref:translocation/assembly module TamB domain-containing protein n=1 Tax=Hongsoonwoonella zoysiae TaxID=2821844 RepID=UPI0015608B87|nr:translocation/assembly module TamB domain-containing protein [Hongsoonwoonella zoysiae]NRG18477.1 translocation/assembly module TamB domain-containing protein [Hongsoonwoonella zoysiae]